MKLRVLVFILGIFQAGAAHSYTVVNSGKDFKRFLELSQNSTPDQMQFDWNSFEDKYADVYSEVVFSHANPNWLELKGKALTEFFAKLPSLQNDMFKVFDQADSIVRENFAHFKKVVPNITPNVTFIFVPAALRFNGMETILPKRGGDVVILGVDAIVNWKHDINVLLTHELFHRYHFEVIGRTTNFGSITSNLWTEGLATYVSSLANPGINDATILYDKDLADACANKEYVSKLAKEFKSTMYRTFIYNERDEFLRDWFLLSGKTLPRRQGYCLGLQVVRVLAKKYPLKEMSSWGGMEVEDKVEAALKSLSN